MRISPARRDEDKTNEKPVGREHDPRLTIHSTPMSYMQELETRLKDLLDAFGAGDISRDKFIGDIKVIALESYRNGLAAKQPEPHATVERQVAQEFRNEKRSSGQVPFRKQYYKR